MKQLLALTLATLLILLSVTACSNTENSSADSGSSSAPTSSADDSVKKEYTTCTVNFGDVKTGYIHHMSGGNYSIEEEDGYQTTDNFYLYLPVGTIISCEKEFGFHCYNEDFVANSFLTKGCGQTTEGFNPVLTAGEYTLNRACYLRFSVKGSLSDIKISVPADLLSSVLYGSKEDMAFAPDAKKLNDNISSFEGAVNYIFISDLHNGSYVNDPDGDGLRNYDSAETVAERLESRVKTVESAVKYANLCPAIDFIVIGGDIINGYETEESLTYQAAKKKNKGLTVKGHVKDQLQDMLAPLKDCKKPVFVLTGNHDFNDAHTLWLSTNHPENSKKRADLTLSDLDWNQAVMKEFVSDGIVRDADYAYSKYYYYDLKKNDKVTRIICLDIHDSRQPFDSKGNLTGDPTINSGYRYSDEQMKWLAEVALKGNFDSCMVFAHSDMTDGTAKMDKILAAYQQRTKYHVGGAISIDADYTMRDSGSIMLYHHGHEHEYSRDFSPAMNFWTLGSLNMTMEIVIATKDSVYNYNHSTSEIKEFTRGGESR